MSLCRILFPFQLFNREFHLTFILDVTIPNKFSMAFKSGLLGLFTPAPIAP